MGWEGRLKEKGRKPQNQTIPFPLSLTPKPRQADLEVKKGVLVGKGDVKATDMTSRASLTPHL